MSSERSYAGASVGEGSPLAEEGFVRLPGAVGSAALEACRPLLDVAGRSGACVRPNNVLMPLPWNDPVVACLLGEPTFVSAVRRACDARDLRWISGYVSVREPLSGALGWHQDWWCWDHPVSFEPEPVQVAVVCYLDQVGLDRAALRVLPGSHRRLPPGVAFDETGATDAVVEGAMELPARAGDAVLMDYRLLHGTTPNATSTRRSAVIMNFTPAWRELPADIRGHLIGHPGLPGPDSTPASSEVSGILPDMEGSGADLVVNRQPA